MHHHVLCDILAKVCDKRSDYDEESCIGQEQSNYGAGARGLESQGFAGKMPDEHAQDPFDHDQQPPQTDSDEERELWNRWRLRLKDGKYVKLQSVCQIMPLQFNSWKDFLSLV